MFGSGLSRRGGGRANAGLLLMWMASLVVTAPAASAAGASRQKFPATEKEAAAAIPSKPLVFTNNATIKIPGAAGATQGPADPYPSTIVVPPQPSETLITEVRVRLNVLTHTYPSDLAFLLVDPSGNKYKLASQVGSSGSLDSVFLTIDDHAPRGLPGIATIVSGSYRPRDFRDTDVFPPPAPAGPYESPGPNGLGKSMYEVLGGNSGEGVWSLYVLDRSANDVGEITGGWSLLLSQEHQFTFFPTVTINDSGSPPTKATPYPATINVSGMGHKLKSVGLSFYGFTHSFPNDVDMLLVAPNGKGFVVMSDAGGSTAANPVVFRLTDRSDTPIPDGLPSFKEYRTTNYAGSDTFPSPAPAGPYGNNGSGESTDSLSAFFDGIDPNGDWSLYVVDDLGGDAGSISQWGIDLEAYPEYDNGSAITLNNGTKASPYPSEVIVQDVPGIRTGGFVRFNGFSHTIPQDVDALLTNSNGGRFVIPSDAGGTSPVTDRTYTLDDTGAGALPQNSSFVDGSVYRPADYSVPSFPLPAPAGNYVYAPTTGAGTFTSAFLGGSPNGAWELYLNGGAPGGSGSISAGWTLGVTYKYQVIFQDDYDTY